MEDRRAVVVFLHFVHERDEQLADPGHNMPQQLGMYVCVYVYVCMYVRHPTLGLYMRRALVINSSVVEANSSVTPQMTELYRSMAHQMLCSQGLIRM